MGLFNASVGAKLDADSTGYSRALKKAERDTRKWKGNVEKETRGVRRAFGTLTKGIVGGGLAAATGVIVAGFKEIGQQQTVMAQTEAVIKSTGGVARVTAKHVTQMADRMATLTGVEDDMIQSGANLLLTFKDVRNGVGKNNDIFDQAVKQTTDMAVALGIDAPKAAMQLGKALNDPARGMSRLQRIGVTFTQVQKDQAEQFVKTGRTMDAQRIILRELQSEFGGSAEAFGKTLPGRVAIARKRFEDLSATLVGGLLPVGNDLLKWVNSTMSRMAAWAKTPNGKEQLAQLGTAARAAGSALQWIGVQVAALTGFLIRHKDTVLPVAAGIVTLTAAYRGLMIVKAVSGYFGALNTSMGIAGGILRASPWGVAATAIGVMGGAVAASVFHQRNLRIEAAKVSENLRDQVRASWSLKQAQDEIANARLASASGALAVERAERSWTDAIKANGRGSLEAREAFLALAQAKREARRATDELAGKERKAADDKRKTIAAAREASAALKEEMGLIARQASLKTKQGTFAGNLTPKEQDEVSKNAKRLRDLAAQHNGYIEAIKSAENKGYIRRGTDLRSYEIRVKKSMAQLGAEWNQQIRRMNKAKPNFTGISQSLSEQIQAMRNTQYPAIRLPVEIVFPGGGAIGDDWLGTMGGKVPPGVAGSMGKFVGLGATFGLGISSGRRHGATTSTGNRSDHATGHAIDFVGSKAAMASFALAANQMPGVKQVIYSPIGWARDGGGFSGIPAGAGTVLKDHYSHVHVAGYQRGGNIAGWQSGDRHPAMLESGEGVLNRKAVAGLGGGSFVSWANSTWPRYATGTKGAVGKAIAAAQLRAVPTMKSLRGQFDPDTGKGSLVNQLRRTYTTRTPKELQKKIVAQRKELKRDQAAQKKLEKQIEKAKDADRKKELKKKLAKAKTEVRKDEKKIAALADEKAGVKERRKALADDIVGVRQAIEDKLREADEKAKADAEKAKADADEAAAKVQDEARSRVSASFAIADAERRVAMARALATESLEDDMNVWRDAQAGSAAKIAELQRELGRGDLDRDTRVDLLGQLEAAINENTEASKQLKEAAEQQEVNKADLAEQLKSLAQTLHEAFTNENGNLFRPILNQYFPEAVPADYWAAKTTAAIQNVGG